MTSSNYCYLHANPPAIFDRATLVRVDHHRDPINPLDPADPTRERILRQHAQWPIPQGIFAEPAVRLFSFPNNARTRQSLIRGVTMGIRRPSHLLIFPFMLLLFLVAPRPSWEDDDADQANQSPAPLDTSDAQRLWLSQSALCAVVAVTLGSTTHPSGRIVGFPSS